MAIRPVSRAAAAPLADLGRGPLVLLFYDGFEMQADRGPLGRLRSMLRGRLRAGYRRVRGRQVNTGFYTAFLGLATALRRAGCDVRINDFALAERMPAYPIGVAGYPSVLAKIARLTNPKLFGPGDPGHPDEAGRLVAQHRLERIIQPSDWYVDLYRHHCGRDAVVRWPAGIDVAALGGTPGQAKTIDVVVYDKIRWHRDAVVPAVRDRLLRHLGSRGLSHVVLRYGAHRRVEYFACLRRARALAFLCEHETQGLACEEAMAMRVPVFAWDEGILVDPLQKPLAPAGLAVSSVPYFDERCGVRFRIAGLERSFDAFWERLDGFRPRDLIVEQLGLEQSGRDYLALLGELAGPGAGSPYSA